MCKYQDGASQQVLSIHNPPGMASFAAEHKESWRILWGALKIMSLIAPHDPSSAKFDKVLMEKNKKTHKRKKHCKEFSGTEGKILCFDE